MSAPRLLVSTGEPSGDAHAARVVGCLSACAPGVDVHAVGGASLAATGATMIARVEDLSVIGLMEGARRAGFHLSLLRRLRRDLRQGRFAAVMLVDYPGFHLQVAKAAKAAGVPVLYYIPPQLWAWGQWRARAFARSVDAVAVILPFEKEYLARHGLAARFVGHPAIDHGPFPSRAGARASLGLHPDDTVVALFPGSRLQEVQRHWMLFRDVARGLCAEDARLRFVVAAVPGACYPDPDPVEIVANRSRQVLAAADVALAKSGTTTLEAAIAGVPMVIVYRVHPVTALVARRVLQVPHIGLVNLVAGRPVAPELCQTEATVAAIKRATRPLLRPESGAAARQRADLAEVRGKLGRPGVAERVADMCVGLL